MALVLMCAWPAQQPLAQTPEISTRRDAPYGVRPDVATLTALGRAIFFDKSLSASGRVSCASCHDPAHAYGPPNAASVQPSGATGRAEGFRATPSLRYLQSVPPFEEHHFDSEGDDSVDTGPTGGYTWDGRVASTHDQARLPMLSSSEMGNTDETQVIAKLARSTYAAQFREAFGSDVFQRDDMAFSAALMALEVFQETPELFYPYSSRYDAMLRGRATLTAQESRGLSLFESPTKGNCASCHISTVTADGAFPLFTDFGHVAIGVPRNKLIGANSDPRFFDLGLCGPLRSDLSNNASYCGRFRTPSLRNVAVRRSFFHNGVMHSLTEVVGFYALRDSDPQRWYGRSANGSARHFDDLPSRYLGNVNMDPPFGGSAGAQPALSNQDIADIVAFLKTLTDADQTARAYETHRRSIQSISARSLR
jgi:cytochrome c peroxidase